jgi:hypothetical protein
MTAKLKVVRAKRMGSWDGHRRRAGAEFVVAADASESWFEEVGPAPEGAELPVQITNAQAPVGKSFIDVMKQLGDKAHKASTLLGDQKPMTLAEATLGSKVAPKKASKKAKADDTDLI